MKFYTIKCPRCDYKFENVSRAQLYQKQKLIYEHMKSKNHSMDYFRVKTKIIQLLGNKYGMYRFKKSKQFFNQFKDKLDYDYLSFDNYLLNNLLFSNVFHLLYFLSFHSKIKRG